MFYIAVVRLLSDNEKSFLSANGNTSSDIQKMVIWKVNGERANIKRV
jgi:hypothetical protein